jgi:hypothetical protein
MVVDGDASVIICNNNILFVYDILGGHYGNMLLVGQTYMIAGVDRENNVILCDFDSGELYTIYNMLQLNPMNMQRYIGRRKKIHIRDITIDYEGNLWALHGNGPYYLTKYAPM